MSYSWRRCNEPTDHGSIGVTHGVVVRLDKVRGEMDTYVDFGDRCH